MNEMNEIYDDFDYACRQSSLLPALFRCVWISLSLTRKRHFPWSDSYTFVYLASYTLHPLFFYISIVIPLPFSTWRQSRPGRSYSQLIRFSIHPLRYSIRSLLHSISSNGKRSRLCQGLRLSSLDHPFHDWAGTRTIRRKIFIFGSQRASSLFRSIPKMKCWTNARQSNLFVHVITITHFLPLIDSYRWKSNARL